MAEQTVNAEPDYRPRRIALPSLYAWPPRPVAMLRYLVYDLVYPWGYVFIALAFVTWYFLTPDLATMATLQPGWIALLWLRNCGLLCLFAGGLHWYLYRRRAQQRQYKFNRQWLATGNSQFLWRDQVRDNMFWSIASGVTFWTLFEAATYWFYASGRVPVAHNPWYFIASVYLVFFWSTVHFYFVHRLLHWQPLYRCAHELHHRNVNTGPWSGISMHPFEHLLYFTLFMLWWIVPVHPVIIVLTGFYQGLSPALSHSGFDYVDIGGKLRLKTGDWYHQLHHSYFNFNYGNTPTPLDKLFGSWHDGSAESLQAQKRRIRLRRRGGAA